MKTIDMFRGENAWLSNFFMVPFVWKGKKWKSAEHAFQASKAKKEVEALRVMEAVTPTEAKRLGRRVEMRENWNQVRLEVMEEILRAKFSVPELKEKLKATGERELVEGNTWNDTFWGVCNGRGMNHLGKLLMKVRSEM